jgi:hypothetical protein
MYSIYPYNTAVHYYYIKPEETSKHGSILFYLPRILLTSETLLSQWWNGNAVAPIILLRCVLENLPSLGIIRDKVH